MCVQQCGVFWLAAAILATTADFLPVDDFESYTDDIDAGEAIWQTWIDGLGAGDDKPGNGTGAIVGFLYMPYYAHLPIVHSGRQSMPFNYDNSASPYYSEAYRPWETPQDWTVNGVTDLSLWVRGCPMAFLERPDGTIMVSGDGVWQNDREGFRYVYKQLTDDGEIVARVESVEDTNDWARAGVMIREITESYSSAEPRYAAAAIMPAHGLVFTCCRESKQTRQQSIVPDIQTPHWLKLTRRNHTFTARHSDDGVTWQDIPDANDRPVAVDIPLARAAHIGLFAAGNRSITPTTAEFSGVAIEGAASDSWEVAEINASAWSNSPDSLYVALEDAQGRLAVSVHPDPAAVNIPEWTQWRISLSDFATSGVDVRAIATMYIGVGEPDNPQPNGLGLIFVDDIRVVRPHDGE